MSEEKNENRNLLILLILPYHDHIIYFSNILLIYKCGIFKIFWNCVIIGCSKFDRLVPRI